MLFFSTICIYIQIYFKKEKEKKTNVVYRKTVCHIVNGKRILSKILYNGSWISFHLLKNSVFS